MSMAVEAGASLRLYARIWRWHFFAALIVIPFVLWQAITGTAYLWHRELAQLAYPELLNVTPSPARVSYEQQLATVIAHHEAGALQGIEISGDPRHATAFFFRDSNGLAYPAFVNPYSGAYLGSVSSTHWIAGLSRGLHGGWPIKPYGSYLLELGASWAIVMILTGLYLWWPRNASGLAGVLYPRMRAGSRTFWRDLHATVGVYFAFIVLAFLVTAMPWTTLWGDEILDRIEKAAGQASPVAFFFASGADHHHATQPDEAAPQAQEHQAHAHHAAAARLPLDELIARARAQGLKGSLELRLVQEPALLNVRDEHPRAPQESWLQLDANTGAVLAKATWQDMPSISRFVALGIDLHEGRFFGRANQVFNTLVAVSLIWMSVTGFVGWYRRRPHGGLAAPPRRDLRISKAVVIPAFALCVVLPLLGASVLGIAIADRVFGNRLRASAS